MIEPLKMVRMVIFHSCLYVYWKMTHWIIDDLANLAINMVIFHSYGVIHKCTLPVVQCCLLNPEHPIVSSEWRFLGWSVPLILRFCLGENWGFHSLCQQILGSRIAYSVLFVSPIESWISSPNIIKYIYDMSPGWPNPSPWPPCAGWVGKCWEQESFIFHEQTPWLVKMFPNQWQRDVPSQRVTPGLFSWPGGPDHHLSGDLLLGGWPSPLKNHGFRQLGIWNSQLFMESHKGPCSKAPTS